jgi:hypothetical protein
VWSRIESNPAIVPRGIVELNKCRRVLIEPLDTGPDKALANAAKMEEIVFDAGIMLKQVHHGYDFACWAINRRALERGHGIRTRPQCQ